MSNLTNKQKKLLNFGFAQSSEVARRQLMLPVPCWERVMVTPENAAPGSKIKVPKWVLTEKTQQFSDDEGDTIDEPLAPLPDEPEVMEVDEAEDVEDNVGATGAPPTGTGTPAELVDIPPVEAEVEPEVEPEVPAAELVLDDGSTQEVALELDAGAVIDGTLGLVEPLDPALDPSLGLGPEGLDMSALPPDGTAFEAVHDLAQVGETQTDALLSGAMMDQSGDPFAGQAA